jgi:hypothetical protein
VGVAMTQILLGADTHQRRCHYAYACADGGAYGASNESASNPASDKADCGFRRNRATHEREGQSYHRNNFHQASSSFGMARYSLRLAMMRVLGTVPLSTLPSPIVCWLLTQPDR